VAAHPHDADPPAVDLPTRTRGLPAATGAGLRARVLRSRDAVASLLPAWDRLVEELSASPFLSGTFYLAWLDELGSRREPLVVAVEDAAGALRAVVPWARRGPIAISVPGRYRIAGELLAAPADLAASWRLGLAAAFASRRVRAVLVPWLSAGADLDAAGAACADLGLAHRASFRYRRFLQPLAGTFDEYQAMMPAKRRKSIRNSRNVLAREGEIVFRDATFDEAWPTLRRFFLAQWTPDRRADAVWLGDEAGSRVDRRLLERFGHELVLLEVGGRPVAGAVTVSAGTYRTSLYLVRDPALRAASPGKTLSLELVRRALEDGVRVVDHMGEGGDKEWHGVEPTPAHELLVTRRGPLGTALLAVRRAQLGRAGGPPAEDPTWR